MKKKWLCLFTALALIVGVCVAEPLSGEAVSPNLGKKDCSMTIFPENPEKPEKDKFGKDLEGVDIQVDIYKVADAEEIPGYDSYTYKYDDKYTELAKLLTKLGDKKLEASDWQELAQAAAKDVLGDGKDVTPAAGIPEKQSVSITAKKEEMSTGLYLLIARGSDMEKPEEYRVRMKAKTQSLPIDGDIATIANSNQYTYIFAPQLISLPMRDAKVLGDNPESANGPLPGLNDDYMTSDFGDWVYDLEVYLKPVRINRYGALEISKKLQTYESEEDVLLPGEGGDEPADGSVGQDEKTTFVFKATWDNPDYGKVPNAPKEISKVDSLTFPIIKDGKKVYDWQLYMDGIPTGTEVTVEEIYSGASYEIVGSKTQKVTIGKGTEKIKNGIALLDNESGVVIKIISGETDVSGEVGGNGDEKRPAVEVGASAAFTNDYNKNQRKGYGINNEFTYGDTVYNNAPGWIWIDEEGDKSELPVPTPSGGNTETPGGTTPPDNPDGGDTTTEDNNNTENNNTNVDGETP